MVVPLQTALQAALSGIVAEAGQVGPQAGQDSPAERTGMPRRRPAHAGRQGRSECRQRQGRASRGWRSLLAALEVTLSPREQLRVTARPRWRRDLVCSPCTDAVTPSPRPPRSPWRRAPRVHVPPGHPGVAHSVDLGRRVVTCAPVAASHRAVSLPGVLWALPVQPPPLPPGSRQGPLASQFACRSEGLCLGVVACSQSEGHWL